MITILSRTVFSVHVVEDLLSCGMSLAKVEPIFTKYVLNPDAIFVLSVVVYTLKIHLEHELEPFLLFITYFTIREDFFRLLLFSFKSVS